MRRIRDYSITRKLTWMNMLVSTVVLFLACAGFVAYDLTTLRAAIVRRLSIEAQIAGANSVSALVFNDPHSAESTLAALTASPHVISAEIYTPDRRLFAGYWRDHRGVEAPPPEDLSGRAEVHWFTKRELDLVSPMVLEGRPLGTILMRSDLEEIGDRLRQSGLIGVGVLAFCLVAGLPVSFLLRRAIAEPIVLLANTARIVSREKNYSTRAPSTDRRDELGILIESFNEMLEQIQQRDAALTEARDGLERRVDSRTAELLAANQELEAFTYSVAHDLRAPVRQAQGFSRSVLEDFGGHLPQAGQDCLHDIVRTTQHMGQLIDDMLGLARVGRQEPRLEVTGLGSIVQEVLQDLKADLKGRDLSWRIGDLPFVECDPGLMKQVLYNLIANAVKYTRPRQQAVIEVGQTAHEGQPAIFVKDNGVGFNMKYSGKLFGVFQRLHRREDFEGTGVGLATVQRIVRKHGGRIWAEAELDKGAAFYFTLATPQPEQSQAQPTILASRTDLRANSR
ncbi:MAG TPA: ATP-binding protein [Terriglobia bacterium]|nr:ATP-binding protein [Terriglobia bacterium]